MKAKEWNRGDVVPLGKRLRVLSQATDAGEKDENASRERREER
jgi:hypothetical protein